MVQSYNTPGTDEGVITTYSSRRRRPSLETAKIIYANAYGMILDELIQFEESGFHTLSTEDLPRTTINTQYKQSRARQQALIISAKDLIEIMTAKGMSEEPTRVNTEVQNIQSQITNIKLTYNDCLSIATSTLQGNQRHEITAVDEIEQWVQQLESHTLQPGSDSPHTPTIPPTLQPANTIVNTVVRQPGTIKDKTVAFTNTTTTNTMIGSICSITPMQPRSTHTHVIVCTNPTCMNSTMTNTQSNFPSTSLIPTTTVDQFSRNYNNPNSAPRENPTFSNLQIPRFLTNSNLTSREFQAPTTQDLNIGNTATRKSGPAERQIETLADSIKDIVRMEMVSAIQIIQQENQKRMDSIQQRLDKQLTHQGPPSFTPPFSHHQPSQLHCVEDNRNVRFHDYIAQENRQRDISPNSSVSPTRQTAPSSQNTRAISRDKSLKTILSAQVTKYDGLDCMEYRPWKTDLEREVQDLQLTASQWLQLLDKRTTGIPNGLIKQTRKLQVECSPEIALEYAWESLNERFQTKKSPSQTLIGQITHEPEVGPNDPDALFTIARNCKTVMNLGISSPSITNSLNQQTTFDLIINRLETPIDVDWIKYRRSYIPAQDTTPFNHFATWIQEQAKIYLEKLKTKVPQTVVSRVKPNLSLSGPIRKSSFSRQYNDTQRSRGFNNFTNTSTRKNFNNNSQLNSSHPSEFEQPLHNSTRQSSPFNYSRQKTTNISNSEQQSNTSTTPQIKDIFCAWCHYSGKGFNHTTPNCWFFTQATPEDRWKMLSKHRMCQLCLIDSHGLNKCPEFKGESSKCKACNYSHHPISGCRPPTMNTTNYAYKAYHGRSSQKTQSYSRTCPVKITHPSTKEAITGLAIIDDQSYCTILDPRTLEQLAIPKDQLTSHMLATTTIQGRSKPTSCHSLKNLQISAFGDSERFTIRSTIIQNPLPNGLDMVPSRQEVEAIPEFSHIAKEFPEKNNEWHTIILIGRDCLPVHLSRQTILDSNQTIAAVQTPLGWTLIGQVSLNKDPSNLLTPAST